MLDFVLSLQNFDVPSQYNVIDWLYNKKISKKMSSYTYE